MRGMVSLLAVVRNKFLGLVIWTLAGAAAAGGINMLLPVVYEASAKVLIASPYWNDSTALMDPNMGGGTERAWGDEFSQQRMASYARLVTTALVTGRVTDRLHLGESGEALARKISVRTVPDTVVLQISAQDASPVKAAMIADAIAQQSIDVIKDLERAPSNVVSPIQPVLTAPASVPARPISPRTLSNIGCGGVVGFLLGLTWLAAYAATRETPWLTRFRGDGASASELADVLGVLTSQDYLTLDQVHPDIKLLRLEIAHRMSQAGVQSFVIASPRFTPTTSILAASLATALTEAGSPTVVVCADFTAGQRDSTVGLSDLLCTSTALDLVIQSDEDRGISWIPAGVAPANPTRELTGPKMRTLLTDLSDRYRHVIVIGPPILESADTVDMASQVGASILVEPIPQTAADELRESERLLGLARAACLGRVVVAERDSSKHAELPQFDQRRLAA
jgi:succinoglycan biosynthesis transport protein ExoP